MYYNVKIPYLIASGYAIDMSPVFTKLQLNYRRNFNKAVTKCFSKICFNDISCNKAFNFYEKTYAFCQAIFMDFAKALAKVL